MLRFRGFVRLRVWGSKPKTLNPEPYKTLESPRKLVPDLTAGNWVAEKQPEPTVC